jgi:hypothetical protein
MHQQRFLERTPTQQDISCGQATVWNCYQLLSHPVRHERGILHNQTPQRAILYVFHTLLDHSTDARGAS